MVDALNVKLLFPIETGLPGEIARVLELLENEPLAAPTNASRDERTRTPYDRAALLQVLAGGRPISGLQLWRSKAPKYSRGYVSANKRSHNHITVDYDGAGLKEARIEELFATWTRLAAATRTDYGFVHCLFKNDRSEEYNYGIRVKFKDLRVCGIEKLHARNWFGPDLTSLIGEARLLGLPNSRKTSWGGVELDLVDKPWLADFDALFASQQELMKTFRSWGFVGNYESLNRPLPGPSWQPRTWTLG